MAAIRNPLEVRCAHCRAEAGEPCTSVWGNTIVSLPHMARLHCAGFDGAPDADRRAAADAYQDRAIELVFRAPRQAIPEPIVRRARRERSIDETKKWVCQARESLQRRVRPVTRQPRQMTGWNGDVTIWRQVLADQAIGNGIRLQLRDARGVAEWIFLTGGGEQTPASWYRVQKGQRAALLADHPELGGNWWRFTLHERREDVFEVVALEFVEDRETVEPQKAQPLRGQADLFAGSVLCG